MWIEFLFTVLVGAFLVIIPGALLLKGLGCSFSASAACAAPVSIVLFIVIGIGQSLLGISNWILLILVVLVVSAAPLLFTAATKRNGENSTVDSYTRIKIGDLLLYVAVSLGIMSLVFLKNLDGPSSFLQVGDNAFHLNIVKSMMESENFSILAVTQYPNVLPQNQIPFMNSSFYPAGWHIIVSLTSLLLNTSIPLSENAINLLFTSIIFPLGISAMMQLTFKEKGIVFFASFLVVACVAFPLRTLVVHQIYPNISALSCVPAVVCLGMVALRNLAVFDCRALVAFFLASGGIATLHPNGVFVCAIFLVSFTLTDIVPTVCNRNKWLAGKKGSRIALSLILILVSIGLWIVLKSSSFMDSVTSFLWTWTIGMDEAIGHIVSLGLRSGIPQGVLGVLVFLGFCYCASRWQYAWLPLSYVVVCGVFFFNAIGDPAIKQFFAGFWYTDPERTAALVAIAAIPLASVGLYLVYKGISFVILKKDSVGLEGSYRAKIVLAVMVAGLFCFINYSSYRFFFDGRLSAFGATENELEYESMASNGRFYSERKRDFVEDVLEVVPRGTLILNMPHDGSMFAYAVDDLNVYYKSAISSNESNDSIVIREGLDRYDMDLDVRKSVENIGVQYILMLGTSEEENYDSNRWEPSSWEGFSNINDDSNWLEVVIEREDMRLYKIVG